MGAGISVETRRASELDPQARALWAQFRAADPALASPYFDFRYVLAAGETAPGAEVAIIRRSGAIVAFLPFQRRGGAIQPMGAPLTDYHGLVAQPGADIDLKAVLEHLRARRFRFGGLVGGQARVNGAAPKPAMIANLTGGYEAYLAGRRAAGQGGFLKDKRRRQRQLAEQVGPLSFSLSADPEVLETIITEKRAQWRRTGQHDVFSTPWTQDLLRRLTSDPEADFGLRVAVLKAGDKIVAAEAGLLSGSVYHLWFPIYDPDFARYSPGALMTLETLRVLAEQGVAFADFGPGVEDYKRAFADEGDQVVEGDVMADPFVEGLRNLVRQTVAGSPQLHDRLRDLYQRLDRRLDRIAACEPHLNRQISAAGRSLGHIGRRHRGVGAGLGLGLWLAGATAGLLILD
ncbi:GNAT family N-acetyltransferase [Phenylobacterium sp.]|uniref:GNAT family N-acetyltransferase n=1 Tax=Phenylobacterium sp. TaxID=1871053 RepID=UPI0027302D2A|nr:GNAT family N-acetyltransferase [Phenylobacterium sp.]MDP1618017.1 GNAT family N-acetyltransferase [Phenylobacterium sp.]MDP1985736.1 GNAT family N-acetyltransferase [Phenylobacterium sp.]